MFRHSASYNGTALGDAGSYLREALYVHCDSTVTLEMLKAFISDTDNTASGITVDAIMKYEYDSTGRLISASDTKAGYKIAYTYTGNKVTKITEYGKGNAQGQSIGISYSSGYTEVRSSGTDDIYGTADDMINVYVFDGWGRAISTYSTDSTGTKLYGAVTGGYADGEKTKNSLSISTVINSNSANYVNNGSFESSDTSVPYWTVTGQAQLIGTSSGVAWDNGSLYMYASPNGTTSITQAVMLTSGTYTMSLDMNSYASSNLQIYLKAISSNNTFIEEIPINEVYASGSGGFASFTFEVTESWAEYTVGVYIVGNSLASSSDAVSVDNIMLAKTTGVSPYNYVNYADFENAATGSVTELGKWYLPSGASIVATDSAKGKSIAISGSVLSEIAATQTVYTASQEAVSRFTNSTTFGSGATNEASTFILSGFGKSATAITPYEDKDDAEKNKGGFAIVLSITYLKILDASDMEAANSSYKEVTETAKAIFISSATGWQYASASFVLPKNSMIKEIKVSCEYSKNLGTAYFDDITLTYDRNGDTTRYVYDEESGNLLAELNGIGNSTFYAYDEEDNLTDIASTRSRISMVYDDRHNVTETYHYTHSLVMTSDLEAQAVMSWCDINQTLKSITYCYYDSFGFLRNEETYKDLESDVIGIAYNYNTQAGSRIFGALESTYDTVSGTTKYFYDQANGNLIAVLEADNTGYYYTYDETGKLIMVQPATYNSTLQTAAPVTGSAEVEYVYNSYNELSQIIVGNTTYSFYYDAYGNQQLVYVGNTEIVYQSKNSKNGKVSWVEYADGTFISYEYDELDRIAKITYNKGEETTVYEYEYDSNGNIAKFIDSKNGTTTIYKYNASGKLVKMIEYDTEELVNIFGISYKYDSESRLSNMYYYTDYLYNSTSNDGLSLSYSYTYNDGDSTLIATANPD